MKELQKIIDDAPEGATHVEIHESGNVNCYQRHIQDGLDIWSNNSWYKAEYKTLGECWFIRSLEDIKQILELQDRIEEKHNKLHQALKLRDELQEQNERLLKTLERFVLTCDEDLSVAEICDAQILINEFK